MEEGLIVDEDAFNSYSHTFLYVVDKENIDDDLDCSNVLIEKVRDIELPFEKKTININKKITSQEILDSSHEVAHEYVDLSNI